MTKQGTVNYERFPNKYFSGSNVKIYFDNVFLDEATSLSFIMAERLKPIQGYNSYTYDSVARGARIVQGQFSINFKDHDYLFSLVDAVVNDTVNYERGSDMALDENFTKAELADSDANRDKLYNYVKKGWSKDFDRLKTDLEDKIWNEPTGEYRNDDSPFFPDQPVSFDIVIEYGPYYRDNRLDVEKKYARNVNTGTVKAIRNVQIKTVAQQIDGSGKPVQEMYEFIAQDIERNNDRIKKRIANK